MATYPNIMGEDKHEVVQYKVDVNHFFYLDPTHTSIQNMFFMESTMSLKDNIWDFFDFSEYEVVIPEHSNVSEASRWIPPSRPVHERTYVEIFLRQDELKRLYKREEYDLLTYLGDLGGLLDLIMLMGVSLSSPFVLRMLHAALIKKSYLI